MILINWLFDKLGYIPKISIDTAWDFPVIQPTVAKKTTKAVTKKTAVKKPAKKKI